MLKYIDHENLGSAMSIRIGRIADFTNVCPVSGKAEKCNVEIFYRPRRRLLELQSFREYMAQGFASTIEDIALQVHADLAELLEPRDLIVEVFLVDPGLTPWSARVVMEPRIFGIPWAPI